MKKIIFLGGAYFQCSIIKKAINLGFHTICIDNRPENPGHKIAHQSFNVSTIEKKKILKIFIDNNVDGIISRWNGTWQLKLKHLSVLELNLPGPSNKSANITKKHNFRSFLNKTGIQKTFFKD